MTWILRGLLLAMVCVSVACSQSPSQGDRANRDNISGGDSGMDAQPPARDVRNDADADADADGSGEHGWDAGASDRDGGPAGAEHEDEREAAAHKARDAAGDRADASVQPDASTTTPACMHGSYRSCYDGPPMTNEIGVCRPGMQLCVDGEFGACEGATKPSAETCDGLDNDCDALVDEGLGKRTCGVGECKRSAPACLDGHPGTCTPAQPGTELCDGLDNDCDGTPDNGNPAGGQACDTGMPGACAPGTTACVDGALHCTPSAPPRTETCNGSDDDCDGTPDNGNPGGGDACSTGQPGVCAAGVEACVAGKIVCQQSMQASAEVCDGVDNNCDGVTDEDCDDPVVQYVSPYIGISNTQGTLIARGRNFKTASAFNVLVGTHEVGPVTAEGDTQFTLHYPALPAGRYPISVEGSTGPDDSAELVVIDPPALTNDVISAPSRRSRLIYDAERATLYGVNPTDQEIERYQFASGSWSTLAPYVWPQVTDAGLTPNGRAMIVLSRGAVSDAALGGTEFIAQERAPNPDTFCGGYLAQLAMTNDGNAFIIYNLANCSGFSQSYLYNVQTHTLVENEYPNGSFYSGLAGASADGSRVYIGSNGVSPAQGIAIFNALDHDIVVGTPSYNLSALSVSGDASRVVLQNSAVYSRSLSLTGNVPTGGVVLASRDSSRAFVYREDGQDGPRLVVYELNGSLQSGALYPVLKTIPLSQAPNTTDGSTYTIALASTPDDAFVFISGNARIVIVKVD